MAAGCSLLLVCGGSLLNRTSVGLLRRVAVHMGAGCSLSLLCASSLPCRTGVGVVGHGCCLPNLGVQLPAGLCGRPAAQE